MSKLEDNVNEILGLDPSDNEKSMVTTESFKPPVERKEGDKDIDVDYDYSRDSYYNLGFCSPIHPTSVMLIPGTNDLMIATDIGVYTLVSGSTTWVNNSFGFRSF